MTSYVADDQIGSVLPGTDALILACPLTERTSKLIGGAELGCCRPGAVVVNIGPRPGHRRGRAGRRPDVRPPRRGLPGRLRDRAAAGQLAAVGLANVLISPHSAATVSAENRLLTDLFIDNLRRWLDGGSLRNVFDRAAGY